LDSGGDALAYSNDGQYLALGLLNGQLKVVNSQFNQLVERKDRKGAAIQVIKFSPNDTICVTGGHD
jgi:WD40 repeat protein